MRYSPGCKCCCTCTAKTDQPPASTGATLGGDWTDAVVGWDRLNSGGRWGYSNTAGELAVLDTLADNNDYQIHFDNFPKITNATIDDACSLLVDYTDSSNYVFIRFTLTDRVISSKLGWKVEVGTVIAGSETVEHTAEQVNHGADDAGGNALGGDLRVCVSDGLIKVQTEDVNTVAGSIDVTGISLNDTKQIAVLSDVVTTEVSFNLLSLEDCCSCTDDDVRPYCWNCGSDDDGPVVPDEIVVDLGAGGWTDRGDSWACDSTPGCAEVQGEFSLVRPGSGTISADADCTWSFSDDWCADAYTLPSTYSLIIDLWTSYDATNYYFHLEVHLEDGVGSACEEVYKKTVAKSGADSLDCGATHELTRQTSAGPYLPCNTSGRLPATITITPA
jgi:hypothetical protein